MAESCTPTEGCANEYEVMLDELPRAGGNDENVPNVQRATSKLKIIAHDSG